MDSKSPQVSIIIPARNAMGTLGRTLESILKLNLRDKAEVIVVNDALDENIAQLAGQYPVKVVEGNDHGLAAARNIGVRHARGWMLVFLDADCLVFPGWLKSHLETHLRYDGLLAVGGPFCLKNDSTFWARCDHYCSWYNVGPGWPAAWVPNHPGGNFSISRSTFDHVGQFREDLPRQGVHEDFEWQARLSRFGGRIRFEPRASVWHIDRDDLRGFLKHNYQWGYNSILVKEGTSVSRFPWVYRKPWIIIGFLPFSIAHTLYTITCWLKAGKFEPLILSPIIFIGRLFYAIGVTVGGLRVIRDQRIKFEN